MNDASIESKAPLEWPHGIPEFTVKSGTRRLELRPIEKHCDTPAVLFMIREEDRLVGSIRLGLEPLRILSSAVFQLIDAAFGVLERRFVVKLGDHELAQFQALAARVGTSRGKLVRKWIAEQYTASFGDAPPPPIPRQLSDRPIGSCVSSRGRSSWIPHRAGMPRGRVSP